MPVHKDLLGQRVGERLRAARRNNNLSQKELGALIGTSAQQILKYEKAVDTPSLSRLVQLAESLNTPLSFFLGDHYELGDIKNIDDTLGNNILSHAYGILNQSDRMLLLSIAAALVECSNAGRVHRPRKTARTARALANEHRGPGD